MPSTVSRNPEDNLGKRKRQLERSAPALFDPAVIQDVHGPDALKQQGDTYIFENKTFINGMLILKLQSLHTLEPIPFPSLKEVTPFVDAGFVDHNTALVMTQHEELPRLRPGNSVVILDGEQAGCKALVVSIEDYIACLDIDPLYVTFPKPSHLVDVPIYHMQRILHIGDYVHVREDAENLAGWSGSIVAISEDGNGGLYTPPRILVDYMDCPRTVHGLHQDNQDSPSIIVFTYITIQSPGTRTISGICPDSTQSPA
jgi:hypothetical protein